MLYIKAGAANMAGAWFIHRPVRQVRGLYRPVYWPAWEMHCNNLRLVLGLGLVRVSSRVRVRIRVKVRFSVLL